MVIPAEGTIHDTRDTTRAARGASCTPFLSGEAPRCQSSSEGVAAVCDRDVYCREAGCTRARDQFNASGAAMRSSSASGNRGAAGSTLRYQETKEDIVAIAAKKAPAKRATARKAVKKRAVKKAPARKTAARKTTARKTAKKAVKKRAVKKTTARKTAKKRAPAKKTAARKTTAKKVAKRRPAKKTAARKTTRRRTVKKTAKRV